MATEIKIAIHHTDGSFSDRWVRYCQEYEINYKIVNCYQTDIITQLSDCDALLWHHRHDKFKDVVFAKSLLFSLEQSGFPVFPDFRTGWHYDDKIGQKYLLEAINAPLIPSFVFYDRSAALKWAERVDYPIVFKLRGGAGSANVKLIQSKSQAASVINKSFGKGISQYDRFGNIKETILKKSKGGSKLLQVAKSIGRAIFSTEFARMSGREKGYVYFQEFMPSNDHDIRLIVIKNRAYGMKRMTRKGDFRASGSNEFVYEPIPNDVLKIGFDVSKKLGLQAVAFDFVYDKNRKPVIVELSYGFGTKGSNQCPGYWDVDLNWYEGAFNPQQWMIEDVINTVRHKNNKS